MGDSWFGAFRFDAEDAEAGTGGCPDRFRFNVRLRVVGSGWIVNDYRISFTQYRGAESLQQSLGPRLLRIPFVQRLHRGYRRLGFLSVLLAYLFIGISIVKHGDVPWYRR